MEPEQTSPRCNILEIKVPEDSDQARLIDLLKQEIDKSTGIVEHSDYLIIKLQKFAQTPYSK